jgi:hypothetical protein
MFNKIICFFEGHKWLVLNSMNRELRRCDRCGKNNFKCWQEDAHFMYHYYHHEHIKKYEDLF